MYVLLSKHHCKLLSIFTYRSKYLEKLYSASNVCACWQEMFNLEHISDAPNNKPDLQAILAKERQKALKKRFKKLRQRMVFR